MMLREIQAFQACWLDLKDVHPTSREENTLIAQAMGQLVDGYQKPEYIEGSLPEQLKVLFRRLALAYFQGYYPRPPAKPGTMPRAGAPTGDHHPDQTQQQDIVNAVERVKQLAQQSRQSLQRSRADQGKSFSEMDTLIIAIPEHWQSNAES
jgi:hypothetical protein